MLKLLYEVVEFMVSFLENVCLYVMCIKMYIYWYLSWFDFVELIVVKVVFLDFEVVNVDLVGVGQVVFVGELCNLFEIFEIMVEVELVVVEQFFDV